LSIAASALDGIALETVRANMAQVEKQLTSGDLAEAKRRAEGWQPAK
jgi:hypothetical protein